MFLIASGAYINQEMRTEFGFIPPVFLPLGNQKLLELQLRLINSLFPDEEVYLSVPEGVDIESIVGGGNIKVVYCPLGLTLTESLLFVMNVANNDDDGIRILNGDTLFSSLPLGFNVITTETVFDNYDWDYLDHNDRLALTGYFSFSDKQELIRCLALSKNNLKNAISRYQKKYPLRLESPQKWYDLGHLNSYFESRAEITSERAFNSIQVIDGELWKTGQPIKKIKAEANWYERIPGSLRIFTPQFLGMKIQEQKVWYGVEYLPFLPLNELFVHGKQDFFFWKNVTSNLFILLSKFRSSTEVIERGFDSQRYVRTMYAEKTYVRVGEILQKESLRKLYSMLGIEDIVSECISKTMLLPVIPSILHGDFCFSNILYSARGKRFKLIDPRGLDGEGNISIYGDQKYDIAKLIHSVIGLYDYIISGEYKLKDHKIVFSLSKEIEEFREYFLEQRVNNLSIVDYIPLVVLLFITMIPLHSDRPDRQVAFLINAKHLYDEYVQ